MKKFLLVNTLIFLISSAYAQNELHTGIAEMEQKRWEKANAGARVNAAFASDNFDITYFRFRWEVDPAVRYIRGNVTVYYKTTAAGNSISFDLINPLSVTSVTQRGSALSSVHLNNLLTVDFPAPVAAGVSDSVTIVYEGIPSTGSFETSSHGNQIPVLWTLSEPFGSRDWWPCKNGLDDKADSIDVYITHPNAYRAASNGILKTENPAPGNKTITHWKHRYPIASYLVCMAVTNYNVFSQSAMIGQDLITMQTHCYPESQGIFQTGANTAMAAMSFFSGFYGPYPFKKEKYGHVQFGWGGGMEHQTASFMYNHNENLVAHELGHHWFGDKITCGNWEDIWLNEGFATFLASSFLEQKYAWNKLAYRTNAINLITSLPGGSVKVDDVTNSARIFSNRLSYTKGSYLLFMLRWTLGDAAFFNGIQNYLNDPALAYGFATTGQLKSHLEAASGKDLTYFFDQWYSGQGYPSYQVDWYPHNNSVQVKLKQTTSHASVSFFKLPVPVLFRNSVTNQTKLVVLQHTFSGQVFMEDLGFAADQAFFDPDLWLVTKNNTVSKVQDPLPVVFKSFQAECAGGLVSLVWETTEEINADHFEIEKSEDARKWTVVDSVRAAGFSNEPRRYSYKDVSGVFSDSYYRIVEVDAGGARQYTRILAAHCAGDQTPGLTIQPNPAGDKVVFSNREDTSGKNLVTVYDLKGRKVFEKRNVGPGHELDVSSLSSGLYVLKIENEVTGATASSRFIKK